MAETQRAAVGMMLGIVDATTRTPEERENVVRSFDEAADSSDPVTARVARLLAEAVRGLR